MVMKSLKPERRIKSIFAWEENGSKTLFKLCDFAVESAILEKNGVIGEDIENENKLTCIDFNRIRGDRPFEISSKWFKEMSQDFES